MNGSLANGEIKHITFRIFCIDVIMYTQMMEYKVIQLWMSNCYQFTESDFIIILFHYIMRWGGCELGVREILCSLYDSRILELNWSLDHQSWTT